MQGAVIGDTVHIDLGYESFQTGGELIAVVTDITESTISLAGTTFPYSEVKRLKIIDTMS